MAITRSAGEDIMIRNAMATELETGRTIDWHRVELNDEVYYVVTDTKEDYKAIYMLDLYIVSVGDYLARLRELWRRER